MEVKRLSPLQKIISIMIDEVAIRPNLTYLRNSDQFIGEVDMGSLVPKEKGVMANKLLTFAINGLSTPFTIPIAYYLGIASFHSLIF
jgi:hypothetical protein